MNLTPYDFALVVLFIALIVLLLWSWTRASKFKGEARKHRLAAEHEASMKRKAQSSIEPKQQALNSARADARHLATYIHQNDPLTRGITATHKRGKAGKTRWSVYSPGADNKKVYRAGSATRAFGSDKESKADYASLFPSYRNSNVAKLVEAHRPKK